MIDPFEEAAKEALRLNQVTLILGVLALLNESASLEEAKERIQNLLQSLTE